MNINDFLLQQKQKTISESIKLTKNSHNQLKGISEDADFNNANSFDDFMPETSTNDSDPMFSDNQSMDDFGGYDDGFGSENPEGDNIQSALDFLENVDESEVNIVRSLLASYSKLYHNNLHNYNRLITEQLSASEYHDEVEDIKKKYKTTLGILETYIKEKYEKETTPFRVTTFLEYKAIFTELNTHLNDILNKINK